MDDRRQAAWESAITRAKRGEEVPTGEHYELVRDDLFCRISNKADRHEEATNVVRYWLARVDCSPIPWRGPKEADNWSAMRETWGEERQSEKLRNMITASADDPDYWEALNLIAARLHEERRPFPPELADWASRRHRELSQGEISRPPKKQSNKGQPPYAKDVRDFSYADVFGLLGYLGLTSRTERYEAIATVFGESERTVADAIKTAGESDRHLPAPWECWPRRT
ncbi:MAG: hypothetical protein OXG35_19665 [Acidobacteria bacterium]|nr:hypothetical protein [Acidobacteriota bacterium]